MRDIEAEVSVNSCNHAQSQTVAILYNILACFSHLATVHLTSEASLTPRFGKSTSRRIGMCRSLCDCCLNPVHFLEYPQQPLRKACLLSSQPPNLTKPPTDANMDAPEQPTKCKACAAPIVQQEVKNEDEDERGTAVYRKRAVKPIIEDECDMNFQDEDEDKIKVKSEHEDQDNVEVENEDEDGNENDVKVKSEVQDKDDSDIKNVDMEGRESGNAHENDYDIDEREVTQAFDDDYDDEKHVQCALCKGAWYCSDKCETADLYVHPQSFHREYQANGHTSLSHRDSCRVRQRVFALQKQCFMCEKSIENEEIHCTACDRIMYCSAACQEADK